MDELDEEARRLVDLVREARTPDADARRRVAARLAQVVGTTAAVGTGAAAAKGAAAAEVGNAAAAASTNAVGQAAGAASIGVGAAVKAGAVVSAGAFKWAFVALLVSAGAAAGVFVGRSDGVMVYEPPASVVVAKAPAPVVDMPAETRSTAAVQATAEPAAGVESTEAKPVSAPLAMKVAPARKPDRSRIRGRTAPAVSSLQADLDLLHGARVAFERQDAKGALRMLRRHRARFPDSALSLERQALQALCLCDLGRHAEAARVASTFLRAAPESPLRSAVLQRCAGPLGSPYTSSTR